MLNVQLSVTANQLTLLLTTLCVIIQQVELHSTSVKRVQLMSLCLRLTPCRVKREFYQDYSNCADMRSWIIRQCKVAESLVRLKCLTCTFQASCYN